MAGAIDAAPRGYALPGPIQLSTLRQTEADDRPLMVIRSSDSVNICDHACWAGVFGILERVQNGRMQHMVGRSRSGDAALRRVQGEGSHDA